MTFEGDKKRYFTSRIIDDLDHRIRATNSNQERNVLFAKKAFALARHSLVPEARMIIKNLRQINHAYEPQLSAWIMFAEGVIEHSDTLDIAKAKDWINRAHLVGQAANDPSLAATAAAWLAHLAFVQGKYGESQEFLVKAFAWSTADDAEARARASMTLGMGFYFAGDLSKAKSWFQEARDHAVRSGDIAMQNIVLFNSSAFHVAQLTIIDCFSSVDPTELNFAVMSAQSAGNLNMALGISNQPSLVPVQRAELFTIEKKWQSAIDIFDEHIGSSIKRDQSAWTPKFLAQRAWCKANIQDFSGAQEDIDAAISEMESCKDPDDRCVLHLRISNSFKMMGKTEFSDHHAYIGREFFTLHNDHQTIVNEGFNAVALSIRKK